MSYEVVTDVGGEAWPVYHTRETPSAFPVQFGEHVSKSNTHDSAHSQRKRGALAVIAIEPLAAFLRAHAWDTLASPRLSADADDDGRPKAIGELTYRWSREGTGVGVVDFSDATGSSTTATFSRPGSYRIRCTVSDGVREAYDEVIINCKQP